MTLLATRNSLPADFASIIGWMEAGDIDTSSWITHRAPIEEAADHFPRWVEPESGVLKAIIAVAH
jgi:alcohol dehydrogenase